VPPRPVPDRGAISQLLYDALALSAWKERDGERWSLRVNPSSGNLHPTEAYLAGGPFPGLTGSPALLHYAPYEHALELRATLPRDAWRAIAADLPPGAFLAGLTSIRVRESWKYGERAYRYCLLDAGHAIAALAIAAAALGWRTALVDAWSDRDLAALLGTDRQAGTESEQVEALVAIWPGGADPPGARRTGGPLPPAAREALAAMPLAGRPNRLGDRHRAWPELDAAARAAERGAPADGERRAARRPPEGAPADADRGIPARRLVRQRRTALELDGTTAMPRDRLFAMLARTLPAASPAVFGALPPPAAIHLVLLVHRVDGLAPGIYLLPRDPETLPELRDALRGAARWEAVEGAPAALPLHRLAAGDVRAAARLASCDQDVAADGAFAAAMIARFEPTLRAEGAWAYRRLHWEAGAVGHVLYLEAEAAVLGATAMGCFLDDELHRLIGLEGRRFQSLYHFAVGRPVHDPRLRTAAPYAHLRHVP
jgi:SagB-type dehydrogenase family enzyme